MQNIFSNHNGINLEANNRKSSEKSSNIWKWNNTLLDNPWIEEKIKREIRHCLESNGNENMIYQNLWDISKVVLRGEIIELNTYINRGERSQIDSSDSNLKN